MGLKGGQAVYRHFLLVGVAVALSSCGGAVRSTIESFHELPESGQGRSIVILPGNTEKSGTLEFRNYQSKLAARLQAEGYRVVPASSGSNPDYVAFFSYGIDDGQLVSRTYSIPQWGVTGYSGSSTYGTVNAYGNTATYSGTTTYTPQYGVTGYRTGTATSTVFTRAVVLEIYDGAKVRQTVGNDFKTAQVYSGKLVSSGECGSVNSVLDNLLEALFKDFPGQSGTTRTIDVPIKNPNC